MSKNQNIDDSVRKKLDGFLAAPPNYVWENINTQLNEQRKKKRLAYIGWISAAAVVVLAFIAGWYFNNMQKIVSEPELVQQKLVPENDLESNKSVPNSNIEISVDQLAKADSKLQEDVIPDKAVTAANTHTVSLVTSNKEQNNNTRNQYVARDQEVYRLLHKIEASMYIKNADVVLAKIRNKSSQNITSIADEMLIADNLLKLNQDKEKEQGWIVGAHVAPGYSAHSASHNDNYARDMTNNSNNGVSNVGGGISIQYKTNKRLRFETGIYYAKDGQVDNNSFELFASNDDFVYEVAADASFNGEVPAFSNVIRTESNNIAMNSTAGVIQMKSTPKGTNIAANLENSSNVATNRLYSDGEFSQVFQFVEVPLYLRYSVIDKKVGVELLGGISAGFIVGNDAYLDNNYGIQNIGSTADISTLNFSGTVGVGLNYMMGKHFSFALEPRLNYYLNSINSNPDVDYRPYRIGVYTGVYYEF